MKQCCAPKSVTKTIQAVTGANSSYIAQTCVGNKEQLMNLYETLRAFAASQQAINDPQTGCAAVAANALGGTAENYAAIWEKYTGFIKECQDLILGSPGAPPTCTTDAECYTSCEVDASGTGKCFVPWQDPAPYLQQCYIERMDRPLRSHLMRQWRIFNASDTAAFLTMFRSQTAKFSCVGPSGWRYTGLFVRINPTFTGAAMEFVPSITGEYPSWVYASVHDGVSPNPHSFRFLRCLGNTSACTYLPPSIQGCQMVQTCNWQNGSQSCLLDNSLSNRDFCGQCYGGDKCRDRYHSLLPELIFTIAEW
jgi:hypothetical protein